MQTNRPSLTQLEMRGDFVRRHIGPDEKEVGAMLSTLGMSSLDELINKTVPAAIRTKEPLRLAPPKSERAVLSYMRRMRDRNRVLISMIGMGYYGTVMPAVIKRNVLENPDWYTAYTPYQAEVSQGRLQVLLNFQHMVADLTAMDIANASLLDEATAAAEAMTMAQRVAKSKSNCIFVDKDCHPQTIGVIQTRAEPLGIEVVVGDVFATDNAQSAINKTDWFAVIAQYPGSTGEVRDLRDLAACAHDKKALLIAASDLLALCTITPPGELGADIVIGSAQRFGVPMGYGGPHAAFFATRESFKRSIPGRIIGVSIDSQGKRALRLALQTREQHIRREKSTSNICTAQVLLAVISTLYAMYHGPIGLKTISQRVHRKALIMAEGLTQLGYTVLNKSFYDTLTVHVPGQARRLAARALESRINLRVIDADHIGIALDETTRRRNTAALWKVFDTHAADKLDIDVLDANVTECLHKDLIRKSDYLTHPTFSSYHSETEMMRYLRRQAAKDITLAQSMIALGSCTMKLNSTTEMTPVSYREFNAMHPFAPLDQAQGYQQLFEELENMLCEVTGFDSVSLQPNAGSQGEYAGLLCIREYHASRNEAHRNICLIPSSAHGTNPASAVMAGMKVVVVKCDDEGNVDVNDLHERCKQYADKLAALMITYPSTHGVFEAAIKDICQLVHTHGGQVYMDGANLNALLGVCRPAEIGADVSHMNLHKTFCIPHGGGGPGMGPIGVRSHLAPFLPDHPIVEGINPAARGEETIGTISAAPWGSASILPISWAYIAMMGGPGLTRATEVAILNANYMAKRLNDFYPVVYTGQNGLVAHECIIDLEPLKATSGVSVEDVAKRLIDYGFHAPTMSWPVHDSLMIEPTESESKKELDRFCDAMISIKQEIDDIAAGKLDAKDNMLKNAPHSYELLVADNWERPYSRERAFFPSADVRENKYWPPVGRVDNVYGDKNLMCSCPPIEDYLEDVA